MSTPGTPLLDGETKVGVRLSPTAITTYDSCPRQWWYSYVIGPRPPASAAMALGTALHSEVESFLLGADWGARGSIILDGGYRRVVEMARAGERFLRPLRSRVESGKARVEVDAERPAGAMGPLPFKGRVDLIDDEFRLVIDHKTTGDLHAPWHKDREGLMKDRQMLLYAWALLPPGDPVAVAHIRYQTKGDPFALMVPSARPIPWSDVEEIHGEAAYIGAKMQGLATLPESRVDEVEWRGSGCRRFGVCPHAKKCPDSHLNRAVRQTVPAYAQLTQNAPEVNMTPEMMAMLGLTAAVAQSAPQPSESAPSANSAIPPEIAALLGQKSAPATGVNPPDARPDDNPALLRALGVVRSLGTWPGDAAAGGIAQAAGITLEALRAEAIKVGFLVVATSPAPAVVPQQTVGLRTEAQFAVANTGTVAPNPDAVALVEALTAMGGTATETLLKRETRLKIGLGAWQGERWEDASAEAIERGWIIQDGKSFVLAGGGSQQDTPQLELPTPPAGTLDPNARLDQTILAIAQGVKPTPVEPAPGPIVETPTAVRDMVGRISVVPLPSCTILVDAVEVSGRWPSRPLREAFLDEIALVERTPFENTGMTYPFELIPFAKGPSMLVVAARGKLAQGPPAGVWWVSAADPIAVALLPILAAAGAVVIRGVR